MEKSLKDKVLNLGTLVLAMAIIGAGVAFLLPLYAKERSLKAKSAEYAQLIEERRKEIQELREKQYRFKSDPDFIETIARQNNRVYPGELVFIFED